MTQWGLDALFNPAKRHMDEEKQRLQSTREEIGDSSGGKRIDLSGGKVVIERTAKDAPEEVTSTEVEDEPTKQPTTAAERARLRHRARRTTK